MIKNYLKFSLIILIEITVDVAFIIAYVYCILFIREIEYQVHEYFDIIAKAVLLIAIGEVLFTQNKLLIKYLTKFINYDRK